MLEIIRPKVEVTGLVADRRLLLTRDRLRVVEVGSSEAAELLAPAGTVIPQNEVARLRLAVVDGRIVQQPPADAAVEPEPPPVAAAVAEEPPPPEEKRRRKKEE
jgi:hypothetical protein